MLNARKSWNPSPPSRLGLHKYDQISHAIFIFSPLPHQNARTTVSIELIKYLGRRKQDIRYVGIAWSTALVRTSLPALNIDFPPHQLILFQTMSQRPLKICCLEQPMTAGIPRYLSFFFTTWTLSIWVIWVLLSATNPGLEVIDHFSKLITWTEPRAYNSKIFLRAAAWGILSSQNTMVSSAKQRLDMEGANGAILTPWMRPIAPPALEVLWSLHHTNK